MNKKNIGYSKYKYLLVIACVAAGFSFNSCSKDSGIGANVLPQNSYFNANFSDTATIISSLVLEDTVPTNLLPTYLLGSYNDPIFGSTKASIYTQASLPGQNPFPTSLTSSQLASIVLDSAVMCINYGSSANGSYYGDPGPQNVEIHLLTKGLTADSAYYSNATVRDSSAILGSKNVLPAFTVNDIGSYGSYNPYSYGPRWRIKLNHAWAQSWMDTGMNRSYTGASTAPLTPDTLVTTNAVFQRHLKGFYITVNNSLQLPGQGGLWYMNPAGQSSQLLFYFRIIHGSSTGADSLLTPTGFDFSQYGNATVTFNHFDHDYTSAPFYASASGKHHDSVFAPDITYVQSMGGVKVKLTIPYLKNWSHKAPIIINKAELDLPVVSYNIGANPPPSQLYIIGINDTSTVASTSTFTLPDQYNTSVYGGTYDGFNQQYAFNITDYIQELIQGKVNNRDFYIIPGASALSPSRVVLQGAAKVPNKQRIRLKIFYTPLKS